MLIRTPGAKKPRDSVYKCHVTSKNYTLAEVRVQPQNKNKPNVLGAFKSNQDPENVINCIYYKYGYG